MQQVCTAKKCRAVFSVGAPSCPQCGGTAFEFDHPTTKPVVIDETGPELVDLPPGTDITSTEAPSAP